MSTDPSPWSLAPTALSHSLLSLLHNATLSWQIRKGANEATKSLIRADAHLIVLAADTAPLAIVSHLLQLCEDNNVPCVYVASKVELGRACGIGRPVVAVSVEVGGVSDLMAQVRGGGKVGALKGEKMCVIWVKETLVDSMALER